MNKQDRKKRNASIARMCNRMLDKGFKMGAILEAVAEKYGVTSWTTLIKIRKEYEKDNR